MKRTLKLLSALLLVSSSAFAEEAKLLVKYRYENQINGSYIELYNDGLFKVSEKKCCPPHKKVIVSEKVSEETLNLYRARIKAAAQGEIDTREGSPTAMGSYSGELIGYDENGKAITIREIIRSKDATGGNDTVKINLSAAAATIDESINRLVENRMPRR
ncbi:MAG TPA: hypothetical protein VM901_00005 [Bdellovibrionota bacterium]|jgi:hypothetical protein|nr:hypothetical protein [Bdellovibrionota bacterium]